MEETLESKLGKLHVSGNESALHQIKESEPYIKITYKPNEEKASDTPVKIVSVGNNRWMHSLTVNSKFYGRIIGTKGATLKSLQADTKTNITVPRKGQNGDIIITGATEKNVMDAREQICSLVDSPQKKSDFTHFISIPANFDGIIQNFQKFKNEVLEKCDVETREVVEGMFQKPEKFHLTVCMLNLLNDDDEQKAIDALNKCKKDIIDPIIQSNGPLDIEFKGLKFMNNQYNHPSNVRILYANVCDETGTIQKMFDSITDYIISQGLSKRERDHVTLHMTMMNVSYFNEDNECKQISSFDAVNLLKDYGNINFGKIKLSTLHISKMGEQEPDGYYKEIYKVEV